MVLPGHPEHRHPVEQTVNQVNQLVGQLGQYNSQIMAGDRNDAGLDAQVHSTLEQLSQYVSFTAMQQRDGLHVLVGRTNAPADRGQQYPISLPWSRPPIPRPRTRTDLLTAYIRSADGADITSEVTTGQLGALLNLRNSVLPSYLGNGYQAGSLNTLAQQFADRVNQLLTNGTSTDSSVTSGGTALFTYDTNNATNVAQTLAVNPASYGIHLGFDWIRPHK